METALLDHDNELLTIMRANLDEEEMNMYITNFYLYLNYDSDKDFVVDFDSMLGWIEYTSKDKAKAKLVDNFQEGVDYIIQNFALGNARAKTITDGASGSSNETEEAALLNRRAAIETDGALGSSKEIVKTAPPHGGAVSKYKNQKNNGGHGLNKETILLTVNCFKEFCMEARTKRAKKVRQYYIKIESIQNEYNFNKLKLEREQEVSRAVALEKERHVLEKSKDTPGIYWLINHQEKLCKFGSSNNIYKRVKNHKNSDDFKDFLLDNITKTTRYLDLENEIRPYSNENYLGHTEIIKFIELSEINDIYKVINRKNNLLSYQDSNNYELEKERLKLEQKKEDNENLRLQIELKKLELSQNLKDHLDKEHQVPQNAPKPITQISQNITHEPQEPRQDQEHYEPTIIQQAISKISPISEEQKASFIAFLEQNLEVCYAKTGEPPLRIQHILNMFLQRPNVSPMVKSNYTMLVEQTISKRFPRENIHATKRRINGVSVRGWYNFKLKNT